MKRVLVAPGYGGDATQPLLVRIREQLEPRGFVTATADLRGRLSPGYEREIGVLRATRGGLTGRA